MSYSTPRKTLVSVFISIFVLAGASVLAGGTADLAIEKTDSSDPVVAGSGTFDYTITVTNNGPDLAEGVAVTDNLPAGVAFVSTSGCQEDPAGVPTCTLEDIAAPDQTVFRAKEYFLSPLTFTGLTFDLVLDQALAPDYFVMVRGSDGDADSGGAKTPDQNFVQLLLDPFGTGDLGTSSGADVLSFRRGGFSADDSWVGVVTVVECLAGCDTDGFRLRSVELVDHAALSTGGSDVSATPWSDLGRVVLFGGFRGAGCATGETDVGRHPTCHARIYPSGTAGIEWTRDDAAAPLGSAQSTVMVLEWGSDWTVQRVRVQGDNGGGGADTVGHYNSAAIASVNRAETWVWGAGHTQGNGVGTSAEGVLLTLGNGEDQNATESLVAAGLEHSGQGVDFEVYALTHPDLAADHRFKATGDGGALTVDVTVASAAAGGRMAFATNGAAGSGTSWPRPMFSARYLSDTSVRLERRRSGTAFPAWVQGLDFSAILSGVASRQYTITVAVDPSATGTLVNDASVASTSTDPASGNDSTNESTSVATSADLSIVLADSADPTAAGGNLTYTVTVQNDGPSDAAGVTVTETLPAGAALVATTGCAEDPAGVPACSLGTLASGAAAQLTVEVTVDPDSTGRLVNRASVAATTPDPDDGDNLATEATALSGEVEVGDGGNPAIATEPVLGNFAVVWQGPDGGESLDAPGKLKADRDVKVRLFEPTGMPVGIELQVNSFKTGDQTEPDVTAGNGQFLVTWQSEAGDGDGLGVAARFLDGDGMPVGIEFQVNENTSLSQSKPEVRAAGTGEFVIAWADQESLSSYRHSVRRFSSDGMPVGIELQFGGGQAKPTPPALAVRDGGDFLVVWEDGNSDIAGLRFASDGMPVGIEFLVHADTAAGSSLPSAAAAPDGGYLVAWQTEGLDGKNDVFARRFADDGMPVGIEYQVNAGGEADATRPAVVVDPQRGFVVTWQNRALDRSRILARKLDPGGMPVGIELRIDKTSSTDQVESAVTFVPGKGTFFVAWESVDSDADGENEILIAPPSELFTDGFESGDLASWSRTSP